MAIKYKKTKNSKKNNSRLVSTELNNAFMTYLRHMSAQLFFNAFCKEKQRK